MINLDKQASYFIFSPMHKAYTFKLKKQTEPYDKMLYTFKVKYTSYNTPKSCDVKSRMAISYIVNKT